jgi:cytochrome P450
VRYRKLRDIIIDQFGTYDKPTEITFGKIKSCQYLQHCNNEALRLYPVVPINGRFANKDTVLPRGGGMDGKSPIFIPKNTAVDYSVHVMHHRKDIWGPDAEDFNPERWDARRVGWEFLPVSATVSGLFKSPPSPSTNFEQFNGGPRICIGQQFAITEASYVTIRLLQRFDKMDNLETDPVVRHNLTLTNCSANGVKVRAHVV